jgi:hypothetical protein
LFVIAHTSPVLRFLRKVIPIYGFAAKTFRRIVGKLTLEIETEAAKALLRILLSCQCPITKEAEEKITHYFASQQRRPALNFQKMIDLAGGGKLDTAFRRLRDCCFYYKTDLDEMAITKEDVIRHFCSVFHWKFNADTMAACPKGVNTPITDAASWFVGHMLLPVKLKKENDSVHAEYSGSDFKLQLFNVFTPQDIEIEEDTMYAIHFASVISEITHAQSKMVGQQLETNDNFKNLRDTTKSIDYAHFQKYGDYRQFCENRYNKYFR